MDMNGYEAFDFEYSHYKHIVYKKGVGIPVLVMHELPGLTRDTLQFTERLISAGFQVYLPLLFGRPEEKGSLLKGYLHCLSKEFAYLKAGSSSPVGDWLRALVRELDITFGHKRIGVIGMCVTGAFVIPLILETNVVAAVASQPAIPFRFGYWLTGKGKGPWMGELNISDDELYKASLATLAKGGAILIQHFTDDRLCGTARIQRLKRAFANTCVVYKYDPPADGRGTHHALLTYEYAAARDATESHPTRLALQRVTDFLRLHLNG
jgi:dienelactone hydrolase